MCSVRAKARPQNVKRQLGRVSHRSISLINAGLRPARPDWSRICDEAPEVLPSLATEESHLGNPGL